MHRRRLATSFAATAALVLAGAAPALASHDTDPELVDDNPDCDDIAQQFDEFDSLESFGKVEFEEEPQPTSVDLADIEDEFDDFTGFDIVVIVKGGNNANVYFDGPFDNLMAPDSKEISHIQVCGTEEENGETPPPTKTPEPTDTPEPTPEPTEEPEPVPTEVPAGHGGSSDMGTAGLIGLLALGSALVAGLAALVGRRFLNES